MTPQAKPQSESTQRPASRLRASFLRAFATRPASGDAEGRGAPSNNRLNALLLAALSALLLALLLPTAVFADASIGQTGGNAYTSFSGPAVSSREGSDLYASDSGFDDRIAQFKPDGEFVRAFGWGVVPGAATGTGDLNQGSATITDVTTNSGVFQTDGYFPGQLITGPGIPPDTRVEGVGATEIALTNPATATATAVPLTVEAGPGNLPTDERQTITISGAPTAGTFTLVFASPSPGSLSRETATIPYNATAAEVQTALQNLTDIGSGNVEVTLNPGGDPGGGASPGGPWTVEFKGPRYADTNVNQLTATAALTPSGNVEVNTVRQGAAVLEACTTLCFGGQYGSAPGQFNDSEAIAVDNDSASASYGDLYLADRVNFRIDKYSPDGKFLLMFGGEVDKTTHANLCTAADLTAGDTCGRGVPGTGPSHFYSDPAGCDQYPNSPNSWCTEGNNSIAVGPGGTVYVGDRGRVQEFEPDGSLAGELALPPEAEPKFVSGLAVDSAGDVYESSGASGQASGVREFEPAGTPRALIRTFDASGEPHNIALDESGDLFVGDYNGGEFEFRAFKPSGVLYAKITSPQVPGPTRGIAFDPASDTLYATAGDHIAVIPAPQPSPPTVTEQHLTDIEPSTATLHALVNPEQFDTHYRFQYVTKRHFEEEGFEAPEQTALVDLGQISYDYPVSAALSGLAFGTVYHYRAVAESECEPEAHPAHICLVTGPDETFETLSPVSVRRLTTQIVGSELVTLKVELNNNASLQAAHYTIHLGTDTTYQQGSSEGTLQAGGSAFEAKQATLTGLQPNTTYHYQLTAENAYTQPGHPFETADQTFTTELSSAEDRAAEDCPENGTVHGEVMSTLREENNSLALPDCRAYEKTTPNDKGGANAVGDFLAPSGERLLYGSGGIFTEPPAAQNGFVVPYVAHRTPTGWLTQPYIAAGVSPSPRLIQSRYYPLNPYYSPELDRWLYLQVPGYYGGAGAPGAKNGFLSMGFADGSYNLHATPVLTPQEVGPDQPEGADQFLNVQAASSDLSRLFMVTSFRELPLAEDPRPSGGPRVYEVSGADGPNPTMKLAAELPLDLGPGCGNSLLVHGTSATGSTLIYSGPLDNAAGQPCGNGTLNPIGLFARTGSTTVQLNVPPPSQCSSPSPCATATALSDLQYHGISPDAGRVWFTTAQPLIDTDTDTTQDLYLAKLDPQTGQRTELVQASAGHASPAHPVSGQGAGLEGVVRVSIDGTHASFIATGVLTTEENALHQRAENGADNLYVYDASTGETKFVTRLCSAPEKSGSLPDPACPANLNSTNNDHDLLTESPGDSSKAEITPDGRFLLFQSYGRLTPDDTDNAVDVYRYDFQTGQLNRVSIGRRGNDADGNDETFPAEIMIGSRQLSNEDNLAENATRSISADGSTVIFRTGAPLVSHDTNAGHLPGCGSDPESGPVGQTLVRTGCDIYQWEAQGHGTCQESGGCISLVSSGTSTVTTEYAVISASGRDITFPTVAGLIPEDTDGVGDIYDTRVDGGFHYSPPKSPCGGNEICHHEPPPTPTPPKITSEGETGGNGAQQLKCAKGKVRVKKHGQVRCVAKRHHKAKKHHKRAPHANRGGSK